MSYWKPNSDLEAVKLSTDLSPGIIEQPSSRTRRGGEGRANYGELFSNKCSKRNQEATSPNQTTNESNLDTPVPISVSDEDNNQDNGYEGGDEGLLCQPCAAKPKSERVILELGQLKQAFECFGCPKCGGVIELEVTTVCIASHLKFSFSSDDCSFHFSTNKPASTTIHDKDIEGDYDRMTDYAINVLYVLGFISIGDGGTEAAKLLGLLGLPNDTTMAGRSFGIIEDRIGPSIRELGRAIIKQNLIDEVKATMEVMPNFTQADFELWKASLDDDTIHIPDNKKPVIDMAYNMTWQHVGSGRQYDSVSGHGSAMGRFTRKCIGLKLRSKQCNFCIHWERENPGQVCPEGTHRCVKNHEGSSGSMEFAACVDLLIEFYDRFNVIIGKLCCDDDSSIRADAAWNNETYLRKYNTDVLPMVPKKKGKNKGQLQERPDKGKLPERVPQPTSVADPNHRRKGLAGKLYGLEKKPKAERGTITKMDCSRISKNYGYFIRTLPTIPEEDYVNNSAAVIEHHFDNHEYCHESWCARKRETAEQRKVSAKYYRSKDTDLKLYTTIKEVTAAYFEKDKLDELDHGMDTNANEALNGTATWVAPQNRVFGTSSSLENRLCFAVGISTVGTIDFFSRLFQKLGIEMTPPVKYYLERKERHRSTRLAKQKTKEYKKYRNKKKYDRQREQVRIAKKEYLQRAGKYSSNTNMDDPLQELMDTYEEKKREEQEQNRQQKKSKKKPKSGTYCPFCGKKGHVTTRSKKCDQFGNKEAVMKYSREDGTSLPQENLQSDKNQSNDVEDVNNHDTLPLEQPPSSDSDRSESENEERRRDSDDDSDSSSGDDDNDNQPTTTTDENTNNVEMATKETTATTDEEMTNAHPGNNDDGADDGTSGESDGDQPVPLDSSYDDASYGSMYHDTGTWSEDENGDVVTISLSKSY